jgi:E3 ubiquitin-protein ligase MARCH6
MSALYQLPGLKHPVLVYCADIARFMYGFAQVISWIRSICRVGSLYFIRDPHDPNYSAVKDMIERPTYSQLHKVSVAIVEA